MMNDKILSILACPKTNQKLENVYLNGTEKENIRKITRKAKGFEYHYDEGQPFLTADKQTYYAIVNGFPILMYPEQFVHKANKDIVDLNDLQYQEAYEEMEHYNNLGESSVENLDPASLAALMGNITKAPEHPAQFPFPEKYWIDARHDAVAQLEAYTYLAPLTNKSFLQLGGSGSHAIKAILAGASHAVLLTPMIGEAVAARSIAKHFGIEDRFHAVIAIGEELPFIDNAFDTIYSGGCVHHMRTEFAFSEFYRILKKGGRFSSVDPWKTPLHGIGTKIFGKREANVFCRPINPVRLKPISIFEKKLTNQHGAIFRYPMLVLDKFGIRFPISFMLSLGKFDDKLGKFLGIIKTLGGSIMFAGEK